MKKTIEDLKANGYFTVNGREYILTEQASFQSDPVRDLNGWAYDNYYSARAICADDAAAEDGYQKCYKVRWDILESYDPEYMGEDCACNWESPANVTECGEYSLETGCYY